MPLKLMYITNSEDVAHIAEEAGVDRIFVDMEYIGKTDRQGGMDTVQSRHTADDVRRLAQCLNKSELFVRVNPIHEKTDKYSSSKEEIDEAYEKNTGVLIADEFAIQNLDYIATPAVLCKNHGPFTWGKDAQEAVHNAVVLEEVAKMAARAELINPQIKPAPQELQDKHYYRKHGANAYYGQPGR